MKRKIIKEDKLNPTTGKLGKGITLQELKNNIENIKSISTIYQKINTEYRHKITIIVSEEKHYEDV